MFRREWILGLALIFTAKTFANPILPWFNKLYAAHVQLEKGNFGKAKILLHKRLNSVDSSNPVIWLDLTKCYQKEYKYDSAYLCATKLFLSYINYYKESNTKSIAKNEKRYSYNRDIEQVWVDQLIRNYTRNRQTFADNLTDFEKFYGNNSLLFNQYQQLIAKANAINPSLNQFLKSSTIEQLKALQDQFIRTNDTLEFNYTISVEDITRLEDYIRSHQKNGNPERPSTTDFTNFVREVEVKLHQLAFEKVLDINTEDAYWGYIRQYPTANQKDSALILAEDIAYLNAKSGNNADVYNHYLKTYPKAKHHKQIAYLLRYLNVVPVPYLTKEGKYIFVDSATSETWTDTIYDFAYPYAAKYHKKWYPNGATLIPGCALVMRTDDFGGNEFFYIEKDGTPYLNRSYDEIIQFTKRLAFVQKGQRYGILNSNGTEVVPCRFERIYFDTTKNIAVVSTGEKWGIINHLGKLLTPLSYDALLTDDVVQITTLPVDEIIIPNIIPAKKNGRWGYMEITGKTIVDFQFEYAGLFKSDFGIVKLISNSENSFTFIDKGGCLTKDLYQSIKPLENGFFETTISKDGKIKYCISTEPKLKGTNKADSAKGYLNYYKCTDIVCSSEYIESSDNPMYKFFVLKSKAGYSLFDTNGISITKTPYSNLKKHINLFTYNDKKSMRWYNPKTNALSSVQGDNIWSLGPNMVGVVNKGIWNLYRIDETLVEIKTSKGQNFKDFSKIELSEKENFLYIEKNGVMGLIHSDGKVIFEPKFEDITFTNEENEFIVKIPESPSNEESAWGVINIAGKFILDPVFEGISFEDFHGYWLVPYNEKNAWLDSSGNLFAE